MVGAANNHAPRTGAHCCIAHHIVLAIASPHLLQEYLTSMYTPLPLLQNAIQNKLMLNMAFVRCSNTGVHLPQPPCCHNSVSPALPPSQPTCTLAVLPCAHVLVTTQSRTRQPRPATRNLQQHLLLTHTRAALHKLPHPPVILSILSIPSILHTCPRPSPLAHTGADGGAGLKVVLCSYLRLATDFEQDNLAAAVDLLALRAATALLAQLTGTHSGFVQPSPRFAQHEDGFNYLILDFLTNTTHHEVSRHMSGGLPAA